MFFKRKDKVVVIGIDGVPYTFLKEGIEKGRYPNLKKFVEEYTGLKQYNSVYPPVSSVAWTSYMTGKNPGEHSIFGFVDRTASPFRLKIPLGRDRTVKTLWKKLSEQGKKVLVMNVPLTFPPEEVNGILISGFLTPDIERGVYPPSLVPYLKKRDYVIDVDPGLGHTNRKRFMEEIHRTLDGRMKIFLELLKKDNYDFAQCNIMETDRINHFFWSDYEDNGEFKEDFEGFYRKLDRWIGVILDSLNKNDKLLVLSDHGFCRVRFNVQLNQFLKEEGYLFFDRDAPKDITDLSKESRAYSLIPGRVYINLKGREEKGGVLEGEYDKLRQELKEKLLELKSPDNESILKEVFFREEIYSGQYLEKAADIIVHPHPGFDLKADVTTERLFQPPGAINGMHTYNDAVIFGKNFDLRDIKSIQDPLTMIMEQMP